MNSIDENQMNVIETFQAMGDDWLKKYTYLVKLGRDLPPLEDRFKTEENLISSCQSQIWVRQYVQRGNQYFQVDCDSAIIKGIAALLVKILSGHPPEAIRTARLFFLNRIGLEKQLSPSRANGLAALVERLQSGHSQKSTT